MANGVGDRRDRRREYRAGCQTSAGVLFDISFILLVVPVPPWCIPTLAGEAGFMVVKRQFF